MTFPIRLEVVEYNHDRNHCIATTNDGQRVEFDPFVWCAFPITDEEYNDGKGRELVGRIVLVYDARIVYRGPGLFAVYPNENGMGFEEPTINEPEDER